MDEMGIADDLMELVFLAANSERHDCLTRGAGIAQQHLQAARKRLRLAYDALKATEVRA